MQATAENHFSAFKEPAVFVNAWWREIQLRLSRESFPEARPAGQPVLGDLIPDEVERETEGRLSV